MSEHAPGRTAAALPGEFADLEQFAAWALPTERERNARRRASPMAEINALYEAVLPRMDAIIEYLNQFPLDALPDDAKRLLGEFETLMKKRGRLAEDNGIYRWVAGYVAFYAKNYDAAIEQLTHGDTDDPFILDLIGKAYDAKGDVTNARQYYRRVMESNVFNLQSAIARPHARARLTGQASADCAP